MRWIAFLIAVSLAAGPAWAKSTDLARAIDLYESGQLSQARDQLRLLVDKRHFSERDRIQARLYLAATDLSLQDPDGAREQLRSLAEEHPRVRPDPAVFSPELVLLSDQIRQEVAQERASAAKGARQLEAQRKADEQKRLEDRQKAEQQKQLEAQQQQAEQQKQLEAKREDDRPRPAEGGSAAAPEQPRSAELTPHAISSSSPLETVQEVPEVRSSRRTWAYVAMGVGATAMVVGTVAGLSARSASQDAASAITADKYAQSTQDARGRATTATVSFIAAGVGLAGGGVLLATTF